MTDPTPAPAVPKPTTAVIPLTFAIAVSLLVAAVINGISAFGFPINAPVEQVYSFGITVDLLVAGVILLVRALVHRHRLRAEPVDRVVVLTIVAAALSVVAFATWLFAGGLDDIGLLAAGQRGRYMYGTAGLFFAGAAWCLAFIFGTIGYRKGGGRLNTGLSVGALAVAFLLLAAALAAGVSYGLGLTD
ncbi:MAG: hypothetical protein KF761_02275 [Salinibacterium sp.]|nr:hypothetical protein [Salinibacterium sp.]